MGSQLPGSHIEDLSSGKPWAESRIVQGAKYARRSQRGSLLYRQPVGILSMPRRPIEPVPLLPTHNASGRDSRSPLQLDGLSHHCLRNRQRYRGWERPKVLHVALSLCTTACFTAPEG